ncbi:MAG TPA: hypothetical protein VHC19_25840, partial [Pirellulales bacterium]|nr:hypothetical protein [Pirellulales bacterium]
NAIKKRAMSAFSQVFAWMTPKNEDDSQLSARRLRACDKGLSCGARQGGRSSNWGKIAGAF